MERHLLLDDIELNGIDSKFYTISEETKTELFRKFIKEEIHSENSYNEINKNQFRIPFRMLDIYPIQLCNELLLELESREAVRLDYTKIEPKLIRVLKNQESVAYLLENYYYLFLDGNKQNIFKDLYQHIILRKQSNFVNLEPIHDFALSWLMYIYH